MKCRNLTFKQLFRYQKNTSFQYKSWELFEENVIFYSENTFKLWTPNFKESPENLKNNSYPLYSFDKLYTFAM